MKGMNYYDIIIDEKSAYQSDKKCLIAEIGGDTIKIVNFGIQMVALNQMNYSIAETYKCNESGLRWLKNQVKEYYGVTPKWIIGNYNKQH